MRSPRRIALATVAMVAVAACSSSESSTATSTSVTPSTTATATTAPATTAPDTTVAPTSVATTTPPTTTATTTAPTTTPVTSAPATTAPPTTEPSNDDAALIALAESALIDLSLFPDGWTEIPATEDDSTDSAEDEAFEQQVDECLGIDDADDDGDLLEAREARSPDFENPTAESQPSVVHLVTVADDEAMAIRSMERAGTPGAAACLQETLQAFFDADPDFQPDDSGIELGDLSVTRIDDGDAPTLRVHYRIEIPLTVGDQTFVQYLEVVYQRQGRALSQLQLSSFAVPFSEDGFVSLTDDVTIRLATIGS